MTQISRYYQKEKKKLLILQLQVRHDHVHIFIVQRVFCWIVVDNNLRKKLLSFPEEMISALNFGKVDYLEHGFSTGGQQAKSSPQPV